MTVVVSTTPPAAPSASPHASRDLQTSAVQGPALPLVREPIDEALNVRIRQEGLERSNLERIVHQLTDVHGPRLTGGPNLENAGKWAIKTMEGWGLTNGKMEPWEWGREGWQNERASGHIVSPVKDRLEFEVLGWTPSTSGVVTAETFHILPPEGPLAPVPATGRGRGPARLGPTEAELTAYLESIVDKVTGRMVLMGPSVTVPVDFTPSPLRLPDEQVRGRYTQANANAPARGGRGNAAGGGGRGPAAPGDGRLTAQQVSQRVAEFLRAHRPLVRIYDAGRPHGQIDAYNVAGYNASATLPSVLMRNEDYGRIARLLAGETTVRLEFEILNRTFPEGKTAYNATAEIRGSDKADEVVMLGGHLDSWHSATGATDNAVGCAVMMEAVRILRAVGAVPRRTIRVALWSGEEQGLLGSRAYVEQHFGTAEQPKPDFSKLIAYWNVDNGTGRIRGASVFGPPEAAAVIASLLKPFEDFGAFGAAVTRARGGGGTDSASFNRAGLPGINASQDPIEYESHTHHTNLDTYERIVWDDMRKAAVITASVVYHLATRDEPLPRFSADAMPPAPAQGRGGQ
jgi:acetylornithine deacetylase/succinyl-diaminopimelate desuccinylase-like protein